MNTTTEKQYRYLLPYQRVGFQECLWEVLWCDGEQVCIRSCGGPETRVEKIDAVEVVRDQRQTTPSALGGPTAVVKTAMKGDVHVQR
jgi:hypothetical protein